MDYDLNRGLRDLGDDPGVRAATLPLDRVLRRAHRRRAARVTGLSAVGATTVVALAVGGMAITGNLRPDPAPPVVVPSPTPSATASPAPTTTPSPTETPEPQETAYEPDLSACGTRMYDDINDHDTDLTMNAAEPPNPDLGEDVQMLVDFATGQEWAGDRVAVAPLEALLTSVDDVAYQWTVIAVSAAPLRAPAAEVLADGRLDGLPGSSTSLDLDIPFVMCPGTQDAGSTPPVGSYLLWFRGQMVHADATLTNWGVWPVTVGTPVDTGTTDGTPPDASAEPDPAASRAPNGTLLPEGTTRIGPMMDHTSCGAPASDVGVAPTSWQATGGTYTATASAGLDGGDLVVTMEVHQSGAPLADVQVRMPSFYVVAGLANTADSPLLVPSDTPRVVGAGNLGGPTLDNGFASGPIKWVPVSSWATGSALRLENDVDRFTCTFMLGQYWPSGTYQVYPFTQVRTSDGTVVDVNAPMVAFTVP